MRPKGTMAVRALPLAHALVQRGHCVTLYLPPWNYPADSGREWEENGVRIINISLPSASPLFHPIIIARLLRRVLADNPDVIHCFKPKAHSGFVALSVWALQRLRLSRARLVVDTDDWEGAGGWNDLENYSRAQKMIFAWQEQWGLRHADALTVASRALETIAWSMGIPPERVFYVPNGARSLNHLPRRERGTHYPTVLLYTRFFEFEVARVLDIFRQVRREIPTARLLVVGKGLFGEEREFLFMVDNAGLTEMVECRGWVEPAELPAIFAEADVAIYPFDDTLINRTKCAVKLIDLLAAGVPVVAEDVGQNREYIESGVTGLLVPPDETMRFAAAVTGLLRDSARRKRMSIGAQRIVSERFTWSTLVERVERAYRDAV